MAMPCLNFRSAASLIVAAMPFLGSGCAPPPPPEPPPVAAIPSEPPKPKMADEVVVLKDKRVLELLSKGKMFESFPIALGAHAEGTKLRLGDGRTPEGLYRIDGRTTKTRWSRELHISYPDAHDRDRAATDHVDPGGGIYIHGMPRDYGPYDPPQWYKDWTEGCVAVGNAAIVKIWDAVPDGTPIDIRP
jgi:murein L,D-transpeptidase YafK